MELECLHKRLVSSFSPLEQDDKKKRESRPQRITPEERKGALELEKNELENIIKYL